MKINNMSNTVTLITSLLYSRKQTLKTFSHILSQHLYFLYNHELNSQQSPESTHATGIITSIALSLMCTDATLPNIATSILIHSSNLNNNIHEISWSQNITQLHPQRNDNGIRIFDHTKTPYKLSKASNPFKQQIIISFHGTYFYQKVRCASFPTPRTAPKTDTRNSSYEFSKFSKIIHNIATGLTSSWLKTQPKLIFDSPNSYFNLVIHVRNYWEHKNTISFRSILPQIPKNSLLISNVSI